MSTKLTRRPCRLAGTLRRLFATALVAGPAIGQQAPAPSEMLDLRLAVADPDINPVTDSALKLAETLGYYEKHGVRVEIVRLEGTPQAVAALNSGHVDLADISIDATLRLRAENDVADARRRFGDARAALPDRGASPRSPRSRIWSGGPMRSPTMAASTTT